MIKRLALMLVLCSFPAWGALEDYNAACDGTVQNVTSATYVDAADTLVFTPEATADFIILAHAAIEVSNTDTVYSVQLNHDSGTGSGVVWEFDTDQVMDQTGGSNNNFGMTWNFIDQRNLDNASHTFSIEAKRTAGTGNVEVESVCIVAFKLPSTGEYAETTTLQETNANTTDVLALALTFTATAEEYVTFFAGQFGQEDDDNGDGVTFRLDGVQDFCTESRPDRYGNNDEAADPSPLLVSYSSGCAAVETLAAGSRTFSIMIDGAGATTEWFMQRGAIFSMPTAEFENFYSNELITRSGGFDGFAESGWQDHTGVGNLGAITTSLNAQEHLFVLSASAATESPGAGGENMACQMSVDATGRSEMAFPGMRDEDSNDYHYAWALWSETLASSGNKDVKAQCASSNDNNNDQGKNEDLWIMAAEIPSGAPPPGRTRRVF